MRIIPGDRIPMLGFSNVMDISSMTRTAVAPKSRVQIVLGN